MKRRCGSGFTLIELLVVIAITAILAAIFDLPVPPRKEWIDMILDMVTLRFTRSKDLWHVDRLRLRLAQTTEQSIAHDNSLGHVLVAYVNGDDIGHLFHVVFAQGPPTKPADALGRLTAMNAFHGLTSYHSRALVSRACQMSRES